MKDDDVLEEYLLRKNRQLKISVICGIVLAICLFFISYESNILVQFRPIFGGIILIDAVGITIFSLINWRCPRCNSYLGRERNLKFCKACGVRLEV